MSPLFLSSPIFYWQACSICLRFESKRPSEPRSFEHWNTLLTIIYIIKSNIKIPSKVQGTFVLFNFFTYYLRNNNNKAPETGEWVCGVGVGVRRGLRGASVPRWSA